MRLEAGTEAHAREKHSSLAVPHGLFSLLSSTAQGWHCPWPAGPSQIINQENTEPNISTDRCYGGIF